MRSLEKFKRVITAPHCTWNTSKPTTHYSQMTPNKYYWLGSSCLTHLGMNSLRTLFHLIMYEPAAYIRITNFRNNDMIVIDKHDFSRFEFKIALVELPYIATELEPLPIYGVSMYNVSMDVSLSKTLSLYSFILIWLHICDISLVKIKLFNLGLVVLPKFNYQINTL